jgi:hypothetical protein
MVNFANYTIMKKLFNLTVLIFVSGLCFAQQPVLPQLDKSPMDISYYPINYPVLKIQDKITEPLIARVLYSRPQRGGRAIFGGLVEYGKVWRLGANEATEVEFFKHVRIGGKRIGRGRYTLYAIANENNWTIIVNNETDTWGAFKYNPKKDVVRVTVPVQKVNETIESLGMTFEKTATGMNLVIGWENIRVALPIVL